MPVDSPESAERRVAGSAGSAQQCELDDRHLRLHRLRWLAVRYCSYDWLLTARLLNCAVAASSSITKSKGAALGGFACSLALDPHSISMTEFTQKEFEDMKNMGNKVRSLACCICSLSNFDHNSARSAFGTPALLSARTVSI